MNRNVLIACVAFMCVAFVICICVYASIITSEGKIDASDMQISDLEDRISDLESRVDDLENQISDSEWRSFSTPTSGFEAFIAFAALAFALLFGRKGWNGNGKKE